MYAFAFKCVVCVCLCVLVYESVCVSVVKTFVRVAIEAGLPGACNRKVSNFV